MHRVPKAVISVCSLLGMILLCIVASAQQEELRIKIKTDRLLIVPGLGAEGIVLGDVAGSINSGYGSPDRHVRLKKPRELFRHVLGINVPLGVEFDGILYYSSGKVSVFTKNGRIVAVAGMNTERVTNDGIALGRGIEYFVFSYGNSGLVSRKSGEHSMYLFAESGIALADDSSNDTIDLFLVFIPPQKGTSRSSK